MTRYITILCAVFVALALIGAPTGALANKLDKKACKTLKSERAEFLNSGILADMSQGPEWVRDNLPSEGVERIKRYLILDATVIFQCPNGGGPKIKHKKKPKSAKKKIIRKKKSSQK